MKKKMKKRSEWVRKSHKRVKKEKDRGIVDFAMIQNHFLGNYPQKEISWRSAAMRCG